MSRAPNRIGMAPPHPSPFIREEILDELGLTVSQARNCWMYVEPPYPT